MVGVFLHLQYFNLVLLGLTRPDMVNIIKVVVLPLNISGIDNDFSVVFALTITGLWN